MTGTLRMADKALRSRWQANRSTEARLCQPHAQKWQNHPLSLHDALHTQEITRSDGERRSTRMWYSKFTPLRDLCIVESMQFAPSVYEHAVRVIGESPWDVLRNMQLLAPRSHRSLSPLPTLSRRRGDRHLQS